MGEVSITELAERYRPEILAYLVRLTGNEHDAQDACQDAFLRAQGALGRLAPVAGAPALARHRRGPARARGVSPGPREPRTSLRRGRSQSHPANRLLLQPADADRAAPRRRDRCGPRARLLPAE